MTYTVYVYSFHPAGDNADMSGCDWFVRLDDAIEHYESQINDPVFRDIYVHRLLAMEVEDDPTTAADALRNNSISESVFSRMDEREDTMPALMQFVPDGARVPSGGEVA